MTQKNKLNSIQVSGMIISGLGLIFIGFPSVVGVLAVKVITFLFLIIGFFALIFATFVKSKMSIFASLIVLAVGFYAFAHPQYVLFLLGLACLSGGLNGLFICLTKKKKSNETTLISSVVLMLLGVFAVLNSKAALATVVLILGIIIVIIGIILIVLGKSIPKIKRSNFFYTFDSNAVKEKTNQETRVIVNIDDDEVEEIDFKEL